MSISLLQNTEILEILLCKSLFVYDLLIRSIFYYIRSNLGNAILLYVLWGFIIEAFCLLCTCMRSLLGFCQGSVAWSFVASCWISSSLCDLSLRLDQLLLVELHGASCCIRLGTRRLISKPKDLSCVYPPFGVSVKTGFWLFEEDFVNHVVSIKLDQGISALLWEFPAVDWGLWSMAWRERDHLIGWLAQPPLVRHKS